MSKDNPMRILAYVHGYFPNHNAGAEAMLHQILIDLRDKGHEVRVLTRNPGAKSYEGIEIEEVGGYSEDAWLAWSTVIFTHLDHTRIAVSKAKKFYKPLVHLVHNDKQLAYNRIVDRRFAQLVIANSAWIKDTVKSNIPSVIVYPPTIPERYKVGKTGDAITLINMNEAKGGKVFWQLARLLPDKKFIGVKGAYGEQVAYEKDLPNVTIYDNTPDIQEIYKKSRIVLMPSSYESWGRVAMEASCSGIPVIAAPTPGLKESLSYAGIFADHTDIADWVEAIRMLDDSKEYKKYSDLVKKRSIEVADEFHKQMEVLEEKLINAISIYKSS